MKDRITMWEEFAVSVASNSRIRTGKQAKMMIDFLMKEREKVIAEENEKRAGLLMARPIPSGHRSAQKHEPQPDGSCSCQRST